MVSIPLASVTSRSFSSTPGNSAVTSMASLLSATSIFGDCISELDCANGLCREKSSNVFWTSRNSDPNGSSPRPNKGRYGLGMVTSFWDLARSDPVATLDLSSWASCGGRMSVDFRSKLGIPTGAGDEASEGRGSWGRDRRSESSHKQCSRWLGERSGARTDRGMVCHDPDPTDAFQQASSQ